MPPEWAPHAMTLLTWPDNRETWPGMRLNRAERVYCDIVQALAPHEPVMVLVGSDLARQAAAAMMNERGIDRSRVRLIEMPVNDVWIRDYGPIGLLRYAGSGTTAEPVPASTASTQTAASASTQTAATASASTQTAATAASASASTQPSGPAAATTAEPIHPHIVLSNWLYNAWGGKYPPYDSDNAVPSNLARLLNLPVVDTDMVLEGGSIDVNGAGCLLTTESVLLNPNRNPGLEKNEIEERLRHWLGVQQIIWLKSGLEGDDTDGHIDDLARFASERVIFTMVSEDPEDSNFETLLENRKRLQHARDTKGRPFEIIELPMPETRIEGTTVDGSERVPASYANFYIANGCVLVPVYDKRYDEHVLSIFSKLFPERAIVPIACADLVWGQGSIHCITQQVPALAHQANDFSRVMEHTRPASQKTAR